VLKRVRDPKQWDDEGDRIVFIDSHFDLFVWLDADGKVSRFQLGYGKPGPIKVFEWLKGRLFHYCVDNAEGETTRVNMMGLSVPDNTGRPAQVAEELASAGVEGDSWIVETVIATLRRG
jgi:hypothetical protein